MVAVKTLTTSEKINVSVKETLNEVSSQENVDGEQGNVSSEHTNIGSNLFKLLLERRCLGTGGELLDNLTNSTHITDHNANELAFSTLDIGSGQQKGRGDLVFVVFAHDGLGISLSVEHCIFISAKAVRSGVLSEFVRLSSHGSLRNGQLVGSEDESVDRNVHTLSDDDDVTNMQEVVMHIFGNTSTKNFALKKIKISFEKDDLI